MFLKRLKTGIKTFIPPASIVLIVVSTWLLLSRFMINDQGSPEVYILGVAQDGGYPQAGCPKKCCKESWKQAEKKRYVVSLGLTDPQTHQQWLFEATPDFREQLQLLKTKTNRDSISGIFITHAHIGHYAGLMQLGREVMGSKNVPVYGLPRFTDFIKQNGPWSQLVKLNNIKLITLQLNDTIHLSSRLSVIPIQVPHRDEFSETAGYIICGSAKKLLFIPDIDKWEKWDKDIVQLIKTVDYALLDATFYNEEEIPGRNMKEIPHPFVKESMDLFNSLSPAEKSKVFFIHFNHTNPLLDNTSIEYKEVIKNGFDISRQGQQFYL